MLEIALCFHHSCQNESLLQTGLAQLMRTHTLSIRITLNKKLLYFIAIQEQIYILDNTDYQNEFSANNDFQILILNFTF